MKISLLGTNGWYDTAMGNTVCTLIETIDANIVLDAGFGLQHLDKFGNPDKPVYILISHVHIDHICGLHVLPKLDFPKGITIYYEAIYEKQLKGFFTHPMAASLKDMKCKVKVVKIKEGKYQKPFHFTASRIKHIDPTLGYRLEIEDKVIAYCCDTAPCKNSRLLARNADLLIHECSYSTYNPKDAWGHSSAAEAAEVANTEGVKKLVLTHFGASGFPDIGSRQAAVVNAKKIFANTVGGKMFQVINV